MTSKPLTPSCTFVIAAHVLLVVTPGCREYTCQDLANCPTHGVDASRGADTSGLVEATQPPDDTAQSSDDAAQRSDDAAQRSDDAAQRSDDAAQRSDDAAQSTEGIAQSTDAMTLSSGGEPTSQTPSSCPDAPEGVCECSAGETQKCALSGAKGACANGNRTCTEDGVFGPCDVVPADNDDCSIKGNDADCDGTANSGCPCVDGDTQVCGPDTDVGQCQYGVSTCVGSVFGECVGAVERAPRRCDSTQDYDCDGLPDNTIDDTCKCDPDGAPRQCNAHPGFDGIGPCRAGTQSCELSSDGTSSDWSSCSGDVAPLASDSCIEGDNSDCVGSANTNCSCVAGQTESCGTRHSSQGICASVSLTCQANGKWPGNATCMAAAKQEICNNNLDENCDGTVNDTASCPCSAVPSPCAHGTCNAGSGSAYTCDCTGTGYEGALCDKPVALTVAGPSDATSCEVIGVSDDGKTVGVNCQIGEALGRGYFWTANKWVKAALPAGYPQGYLVTLSADGTKAAGSLRNENSTSYAARWSGVTSTAVLLSTPEWKSVTHMSANGNSFTAIDPGGNLFVWTGGGSNPPVTYVANGGITGIFSGDGTKMFSSEPGDGEGFRIWTSSSAFTTRTLAEDLQPVAASSDGSVMVGRFWSSSLSSIYKYSSAASPGLNSTDDCTPLSLSSDGRYLLGKCASGLSRWADATPSTVQSLITSTGSKVTIRTDVEGRMSYNAKYVALPSSGNGIVVVHLPSP